MKRKILSSLLVAMLSVTLVACGDKKEPTPDTTTPQVEDTAKEPEEEKPVATNTTAKESSIDSKLNIGETGLASMLIPSILSKNDSLETGTVKVSLDSIVRGDAAQKIVDEYNASDYGLTVASLDSSLLEYAVVEYSLTIPNDFPHDEFGPSPNITSSIRGNDGNGLVYDGILFSISTWNFPINYIEDPVLKPDVPTKSCFVFQIPKGCTDYTIVIGDSETQEAYFKGK
ncbi:hypothetical protein ACQPU1_11810 [Clostridium paraputrificum]|uniref:hypothetical protein n=1 Tax=Clostridium TaxID=1485 RepID=UPI003D337231